MGQFTKTFLLSGMIAAGLGITGSHLTLASDPTPPGASNAPSPGARNSPSTGANASSPLNASRPKTQRPAPTTDALIYNGDAAAYGDPDALQSIVQSLGMTSKVVTSAELNQMSSDDLSHFGAIIFPGGYAGQMSDSLDAKTRENIQQAVQEKGVSYVGICAGSFLAVSPDTSWGFSLLKSAQLPYYHLEDEGTDDAVVNVKMNDGSQRQIIWWGGPYLPEWPGGVVARYDDTNQPAIAETWAGNGLVILSGPHPEAPQNWYNKLNLKDPNGLNQDIAAKMIQAAVKQQPLPSS